MWDLIYDYMIIRRNPVWIKWADYLDNEVNKIIDDNPGKWMTLQIELNQDTWDEIKDIPEDKIEKLTLLEYLKGYSFKMVKMAEIKVNLDENLKGEYFKLHILRKSN